MVLLIGEIFRGLNGFYCEKMNYFAIRWVKQEESVAKEFELY